MRYHDFGVRSYFTRTIGFLLSESDWVTLSASYGKTTLDRLMEPGQDICHNVRH